MVSVILGSSSPYRRELLQRLGMPFSSISPTCDEEAVKAAHPTLSPHDLAVCLADAKAASIAGQHPEAVVIGSDQLLAIDGEALGKPGTKDGAVAQLLRLQGREHELITAMTVIGPGRTERHCDCTRLRMRQLDQAAIERYVEHDEPVDCAGSYKLECGGVALFEAIDSQDHSAITGLPLLALTRILTSFGLHIP